MTKDADKYHQLIANIPCPFVRHQAVTDADGKPVDYIFLETNKAFEEMTGLKREKIIGKKIRAVFPGLEKGEFDWMGTFNQVALSRKPVSFTSFFEPLGRWYEVNAFSDEPGYISTVFHDISIEKEKSSALKGYKHIVNNTPNLVVRFDTDLRHSYVNRAAEKFFGQPADFYMGKTLLDLQELSTPEEQRNQLKTMHEALKKCLESGEEQRFTGSFMLPEGEKLLFTRIVPEKENDGRIVSLLAVTTDITERKEAEEALRKSEERFRVAQEISPDGFTILHPLRNEKGEVVDFTWIYENQAIARINGTDPEEVIGKKLLDLFPTHNGTPVFEAYINVASTGKTEIFEDVYVGEILSKPTWLRLVIVPMAEDIAILAQDITERKQAETDLHEANDYLNFYRLTVDNMEDYKVAVVDDSYCYKLVSKQYLEGYNLTRAELVGKPVSELMGVEIFESTIKPNLDLAFKGQVVNYADWFDIPAKGNRFLEVSYYPIRGEEQLVNSVAAISRDVTEQKQAEVALNQFFSQSLTGNYFMMLEEPLTWDDTADKDKLLEYTLDHQRMTRVNQAMLDQYGASEEDFIGITDRELFQHDLDHAREILRGLFDQGRWHVETAERRMDGSQMWVDGDYICLYDSEGRITGHFGVQVDITDRKQAEQTLRASEKKYRQITDNMSDVVWVTDLDLNTIYLSPSIEKMVGEPLETYINKSLEQRHPPDSINTLLSVMQEELSRESDPTVDKNRSRFIEIEHFRPDGSTFWISMNIKFVRDKKGKIVGFQGVSRDITDRKLAEEAIRTLNKELEQRVKERTINLEALNKELASFAYSISHDFRAPLRALDAFSASLTEAYGDQLDEKGRHYLSRIRNAALYMSDLIDSLLKLSRITRAEINPQDLDLSRLAEERIQLLRETEPQRRVEAKITPGLTARGDRALLRAVLDNLLGNAWKFSSKEAQAEIEVGRTTIDGEEVFFVRDNGAGFNMAYADKLFGAFQRLHAVEEFPGTGIGLATVQRIINRHGGRIWAESEVGKGATFYFTLPV